MIRHRAPEVHGECRCLRGFFGKLFIVGLICAVLKLVDVAVAKVLICGLVDLTWLGLSDGGDERFSWSFFGFVCAFAFFHRSKPEAGTAAFSVQARGMRMAWRPADSDLVAFQVRQKKFFALGT